MTGPALVWFRRDLRVVGNPAWEDAIRDDPEPLGLVVRDHRLLTSAGAFRQEAWTKAVEAVADRLGSRLLIRDGDPSIVVPTVARELGATRVLVNSDVTRSSTERDAAVAANLPVPLGASWGTLVHPPGSILTNAGAVPLVFGAFWRRWQSRDVRDDPVDPASPAARLLENFLAHRLRRYVGDRDDPGVDGTSELSVALKVGAISPAALVRAARDHAAIGGADAEPFVRQIAWRDWFAHLLAERPDLEDHALRPEYDRIVWRSDPEGFAAWTRGETGVPIVDAGMRQLHATGGMHNRVRMITASFLVKDLLVDWRRGERHFRRWLADGDVAQNVGNWQWVAGTGPDAAPYFRVFNPVRQSRKFDPTGRYLRRWLPNSPAWPTTRSTSRRRSVPSNSPPPASCWARRTRRRSSTMQSPGSARSRPTAALVPVERRPPLRRLRGR